MMGSSMDGLGSRRFIVSLIYFLHSFVRSVGLLHQLMPLFLSLRRSTTNCRPRKSVTYNLILIPSYTAQRMFIYIYTTKTYTFSISFTQQSLHRSPLDREPEPPHLDEHQDPSLKNTPPQPSHHQPATIPPLPSTLLALLTLLTLLTHSLSAPIPTP